MYAAANRHPRQHRQGDPVVQGRRRPGAAPGGRRRRSRRTSPTNPAKFDIPDSVIGFLAGELGDPPGGWPEPFRTKALAGPHRQARARSELTAERRATGCATGPPRRPSTGCSSPARPRSSRSPAETYGDISVLPTRDYLYGLRAGDGARRRPGARACGCSLGLRGRSASPTSAAIRTVMCTAQRPVAADIGSGPLRSPRSAPAQRTGRHRRVRGTSVRRSNGIIPTSGRLVTLVNAGDVVATIEAMKMEASITTPVAGSVSRVVLDGPRTVEGGDLILVL